MFGNMWSVGNNANDDVIAYCSQPSLSGDHSGERRNVYALDEDGIAACENDPVSNGSRPGNATGSDPVDIDIDLIRAVLWFGYGGPGYDPKMWAGIDPYGDPSTPNKIKQARAWVDDPEHADGVAYVFRDGNLDTIAYWWTHVILGAISYAPKGASTRHTCGTKTVIGCPSTAMGHSSMPMAKRRRCWRGIERTSMGPALIRCCLR